MRKFLRKTEDKGISVVNEVLRSLYNKMLIPREVGWHVTPAGNEAFSSLPDGKGFTPVKTGVMIQSWHLKELKHKRDQGRVYNTANRRGFPYPLVQELGVNHMFPRPMISKYIRHNLTKDLNKAVARARRR